MDPLEPELVADLAFPTDPRDELVLADPAAPWPPPSSRARHRLPALHSLPPRRRTGREQGHDLDRRLEHGRDPDAGPPLPPLGPPVTADGDPRSASITGIPFQFTCLILDVMNREI
jgi:hypothetical protein